MTHDKFWLARIYVDRPENQKRAKSVILHERLDPDLALLAMGFSGFDPNEEIKTVSFPLGSERQAPRIN